MAQYITDMLLELRMIAKAQRLPKVAQALKYAFDEAFSCANQAVIPLILLRHKRRGCSGLCVAHWHVGQRESVFASLTVMVLRTVAIEFGTWRSGRTGGTSPGWTVGKARFFAEQGS